MNNIKYKFKLNLSESSLNKLSLNNSSLNKSSLNKSSLNKSSLSELNNLDKIYRKKYLKYKLKYLRLLNLYGKGIGGRGGIGGIGGRARRGGRGRRGRISIKDIQKHLKNKHIHDKCNLNQRHKKELNELNKLSKIEKNIIKQTELYNKHEKELKDLDNTYIQELNDRQKKHHHDELLDLDNTHDQELTKLIEQQKRTESTPDSTAQIDKHKLEQTNLIKNYNQKRHNLTQIHITNNKLTENDVDILRHVNYFRNLCINKTNSDCLNTINTKIS